MPEPVHKITIQLRTPRGKDPGKIAEGWYCADSAVVLTDQDGKPIGSDKHHIEPGGDARLIACRMLRKRQNARSSSGGNFSASIAYPKLKY